MTEKFNVCSSLFKIKESNSKSNCHRCNKIIYDHNKLGPVNGYVYHKQCLKCYICDTSLTLKSYKTSQASISDKEVYCVSHAPKSTGINLLPPSKWHNNTKDTKMSTINNADISLSDVSSTQELSVNSSNTIVINIKKSASKDDLLSVSKEVTTSGSGRVAALTKKWNSRDDLLSSSQVQTPTTPKLKITSDGSSIKNIETTITSPLIEQKYKSKENLIEDETHFLNTNTRSKVVGDQICGFDYNKYVENIKKSTLSTERKHVSDLAVKSNIKADNLNETGYKSGSISDLRSNNHDLESDDVSNILLSSVKTNRKKGNVDQMLSDELNFYQNFSQITITLDPPSSQLIEPKLSYLPTNISSQPSDSHTSISTNQDFTFGEETNKRHFSSNDIELYKDESINEEYIKQFRSKSDGFFMNTQDGLLQMFQNNIGKTVDAYIKQLGSIQISYIFRNNKFTVRIDKAQNLYNSHSTSLDTYVKIMLLPDSNYETTCMTDVQFNTLNPIWDKCFDFDDFDLDMLKLRNIYLSIKDYKMASELLSMGIKDEALKMISLGEAIVSLNDIQEGYWYEVIVPLREASDVQNEILSKDL